MPELGEDTEQYVSPYARVSSCEIELDCSCKDILNIWESDRGIIGETEPEPSERSLRESFIDCYLTPFKTPDQIASKRKLESAAAIDFSRMDIHLQS